MAYMRHGGIERWKQVGTNFALIFGILSLAACSNQEEAKPSVPETSTPSQDWQKELSDWIGKQAGLYDEEGNIIPLDERNR